MTSVNETPITVVHMYNVSPMNSPNIQVHDNYGQTIGHYGQIFWQMFG